MSVTKEQTAVDFMLEGIINLTGVQVARDEVVVEQAKKIENKQAHKYAEFAIMCDRKGMKILNFEDWIKL